MASVGHTATTYVFIDTNIFVRYLSQGREGCEPQHWKQVVSEVQTGAIKILLPEIVKLELEKKSKAIPQNIEAAHINIRKQIHNTLKSQIKSTETEDMRDAVLSHYDSLHKSKINGIHERYDFLLSELKHPNVLEIPLSVDILLASKRRHLSGRLAPTSEKPNDADCGIIESLASHFANTQEKNVRLLFCSENTNDFATQLEDKSWALHSTIRSGLPDGQFFTHLKGLCDFLNSTKPVEPPKSEELEAAEQNQEKARIERIAKKQLSDSEDSTSHSLLRHELSLLQTVMLQEQLSLEKLNAGITALNTKIGQCVADDSLEDLPALNVTLKAMTDQRRKTRQRLAKMALRISEIKEALHFL